jgi:hypothetical protein
MKRLHLQITERVFIDLGDRSSIIVVDEDAWERVVGNVLWMVSRDVMNGSCSSLLLELLLTELMLDELNSTLLWLEVDDDWLELDPLEELLGGSGNTSPML